MKKSVFVLLFLAAGVGFANAQTTQKAAPTKQGSSTSTLKTVVDAPVQVSTSAVVNTALKPQAEIESGLKADAVVQEPKFKKDIKEVKPKENSTVKAAVRAEVKRGTAEKQVLKKVTTE